MDSWYDKLLFEFIQLINYTIISKINIILSDKFITKKKGTYLKILKL